MMKNYIQIGDNRIVLSETTMVNLQLLSGEDNEENFNHVANSIAQDIKAANKPKLPTRWAELPEKDRTRIEIHATWMTDDEENAFFGFHELNDLRRKWLEIEAPGWDTNNDCWTHNISNSYSQGIKAQCSESSRGPLFFPTPELRDKFLETFRDLIEKAKMYL